MSHFVCTGDCKAVSEQEGICQSDFCNKQGEELAICGCEDGEHQVSGNTETPQVEETSM